MSGSTEFALPFRRGSTYKDGSTAPSLYTEGSALSRTLTATVGEAIVGRVYRTTDDNGKDLWLRAVRADNALTDIGGKPFEYSAGKIGRNIEGIVDVDGEICSIADDAYASTFDVAQYDIFYVVEQGDVLALAEAGVNAADLNVQGNASAATVEVAVAGNYVIGVSREAKDATTSGYATIYVTGGLKPSDPAS